MSDNTKKIIKKDKIWHKQQEIILKRWSEIGSSYRFMHDRSYLKYQSRNLKFAIPVIVISTITGTANFAQSSFPASWSIYVPLVIGFFNLLAGLITTIAQFLRVSELLEGHRAATIAYSKLSRNISVELSLPRQERNMNGVEFVNSCRVEMDRLIEQSPNIPMGILKTFNKKFGKTHFYKPEILNIMPVDIYIDDEKDKMELELLKIKNEEKLKRELINTENLRRKTFLQEYEQKNSIDHNINMKLIEDKKNMKKNNIDANSVTGGLTKFISKLQMADKNNDIITPSSSNTTDNNLDANSVDNSDDNSDDNSVGNNETILNNEGNEDNEEKEDNETKETYDDNEIILDDMNGHDELSTRIDILVYDTSSNEQ